MEFGRLFQRPKRYFMSSPKDSTTQSIVPSLFVVVSILMSILILHVHPFMFSLLMLLLLLLILLFLH